MIVHYDFYESPLGRLVPVATPEGLAAIVFTSEGRPWEQGLPARLRDAELVRDAGDRQLQAARRWLERYFAGEAVRADDFEGDLDPGGTAFQAKVWTELRHIPYGQTYTYGEVARRVGNPKATRAVGLANGQNPLPILVPCHRVIGTTGKLTGFGGGLWRKKWLLALEHGGELFSS